MLAHVPAGARDDQGGEGRDVDGVRAIAAGADDVDHRPVHVERHAIGGGEHGIDQAPQLLDGLALHAQSDDEPRDLGVARRAGEDLGHRGLGLVSGEILPLAQHAEYVAHGVALLLVPHRPSCCRPSPRVAAARV